VGQAWFEEVQAAVPPDLRAAVEKGQGGLGKMWMHLVGLASESAPPRDVPAFLALLEATPALEIRLHLLGYYLPSYHQTLPRERLLAVAQGEPAACDEYMQAVCDKPGDWDGLRASLLESPEQTKVALLSVLRRWHDLVMAPREATLLAAMQRDAEAKRRLAGRLTPERLIEVATNGVQYVPQAGIRRVLLLPSVLLRPWLVILEHRETKIVCYSVADENLSADETGAPQQLVRLYKALADERRLQILKELAVESRTLQELADRVGISKSLAHHHMVTLRAAGLTRVSSGHDKLYSLREDAIATAGEGLADFLAAPPSAPGQEARPPARRRRSGGRRPKE
jgi:DNA-binding transcriptional ArsR family regulator